MSRTELLKGEVRLAEGTEVDGERLRFLHDFLNMSFDAYVHGAYETTMMELLNVTRLKGWQPIFRSATRAAAGSVSTFYTFSL